jgi:hypothetical protein
MVWSLLGTLPQLYQPRSMETRLYSLLAHAKESLSLLSKGALIGQPGEPRSLLYPYRFPSYVTACGSIMKDVFQLFEAEANCSSFSKNTYHTSVILSRTRRSPAPLYLRIVHQSDIHSDSQCFDLHLADDHCTLLTALCGPRPLIRPSLANSLSTFRRTSGLRSLAQ